MEMTSMMSQMSVLLRFQLEWGMIWTQKIEPFQRRMVHLKSEILFCLHDYCIWFSLGWYKSSCFFSWNIFFQMSNSSSLPFSCFFLNTCIAHRLDKNDFGTRKRTSWISNLFVCDSLVCCHRWEEHFLYTLPWRYNTKSRKKGNGNQLKYQVRMSESWQESPPSLCSQ